MKSLRIDLLPKNWVVISIVLSVVLLNGCSHTLQIKNLDQYYTTNTEAPNNSKVGVREYQGKPENSPYFNAIFTSLKDNFGVNLTKCNSQWKVEDLASLDYLLDIQIVPEYKGSGANFPLTFPGFLVFAPSWNGFYYKSILTTEITISDKTNHEISRISEKMEFKFNYMDFGRASAAYNGWWTPGLGAGSLIAAPFMCRYDKDATPGFQRQVSNTYGNYISLLVMKELNRINK